MVSLGHAHRRQSQSHSTRSSTDSTRGDNVATGEDETVDDPEQKSMLMHIVSQLGSGADLSRITLPTFILEPRSMLERITNFMAHPETLLPMPKIEDPKQRMVAVVKFYLSGWHIKPPGVKKPLNPILGETFTGYWDYPDKTLGYYISEQTSHHPPKSSYFFLAPEHHIRVDGCLKPRSKFLGNSAASMMEGIAVMRFLNTEKKERYFITQPNIYVGGILWGKMKYELGDHSYVRCPENGFEADIEFKRKGWVSGTYNAIGGYIKETATGTNLYELSGMWTGEMYIKDLATGKKELLFDASHAKETPPSVRPKAEQGDRESQKLWAKVTQAVKNKDHDTATDEKTRIEEMQRKETADRHAKGSEWKPNLFCDITKSPEGFRQDEKDLDWIINAKIDGKTPDELTKQVLSIAAIVPGQSASNSSSSTANTSNVKTDVPAGASDDLIDFGQDDASTAPKAPQNQTTPAKGNVDLLQDPLQPTPSKTSGNSTSSKSKSLLARRDSETEDLDEFVDAES